ncbi:hypothetical protein EVAR_73858_1 [Eumeta japonica]|uniref:Uncharacterized protein n=1 Tax=Eumeta variegata TaxID=151549 RepID=A0A4C1SU29_EUMVA|nr:hypothetical protein EVAR_73858_1 [Eumeta japonica]
MQPTAKLYSQAIMSFLRMNSSRVQVFINHCHTTPPIIFSFEIEGLDVLSEARSEWVVTIRVKKKSHRSIRDRTRHYLAQGDDLTQRALSLYVRKLAHLLINSIGP